MKVRIVKDEKGRIDPWPAGGRFRREKRFFFSFGERNPRIRWLMGQRYSSYFRPATIVLNTRNSTLLAVVRVTLVSLRIIGEVGASSRLLYDSFLRHRFDVTG